MPKVSARREELSAKDVIALNQATKEALALALDRFLSDTMRDSVLAHFEFKYKLFSRSEPATVADIETIMTQFFGSSARVFLLEFAKQYEQLKAKKLTIAA